MKIKLIVMGLKRKSILVLMGRDLFISIKYIYIYSKS